MNITEKLQNLIEIQETKIETSIDKIKTTKKNINIGTKFQNQTLNNSIFRLLLTGGIIGIGIGCPIGVYMGYTIIGTITGGICGGSTGFGISKIQKLSL